MEENSIGSLFSVAIEKSLPSVEAIFKSMQKETGHWEPMDFELQFIQQVDQVCGFFLISIEHDYALRIQKENIVASIHVS